MFYAFSYFTLNFPLLISRANQFILKYKTIHFRKIYIIKSSIIWKYLNKLQIKIFNVQKENCQ